MSERRTAILVDGANNHAMSRQLGFDVDFKKVLKLKEFGTVVHADYFTALPDRNQVVSNIHKLVDLLAFNGWNVITKPVKYYTAADGRPKKKGNMDIELCMRAVRIAGNITHIALFAGDGDYCDMVKYMQEEHGIHVTAYSTLQSDPPMIADELRRVVNGFRDVYSMREEIGRNQTAISVRREVVKTSFLMRAL